MPSTAITSPKRLTTESICNGMVILAGALVAIQEHNTRTAATKFDGCRKAGAGVIRWRSARQPERHAHSPPPSSHLPRLEGRVGTITVTKPQVVCARNAPCVGGGDRIQLDSFDKHEASGEW